MSVDDFLRGGGGVLVCVGMLAGCGGGGGDGTVGPPAETTTPVVTVPVEYEVGEKDPYFMEEGEWEMMSGEVGIADATSLVYVGGVTLLHKQFHGVEPGSGVLPQPSMQLGVQVPTGEVLTAWGEGWTGLGVSVLVIDDFGVEGTPDSFGSGEHGYVVTASGMEVAPRASYYAMNAGLGLNGLIKGIGYKVGGVRSVADKSDGHEGIEFGVVNMSFGFEPEPAESTQKDVMDAIDAVLGGDALQLDVTGAGDYLTGVGDAVLVKAAGNETTDAGLLIGNVDLILSEAKERVLIVGALDGYGQDGEAELAGYSNFAGTLFPQMQGRFLVEYGGSPFAEDAVLCLDGVCKLQNFVSEFNTVGTSFAAPRVTGYAALVRGKFPNLSGATTAGILLDTATYEGLGCVPECLELGYGRGRVDLGAALAPSGGLE